MAEGVGGRDELVLVPGLAPGLGPFARQKRVESLVERGGLTANI
jgi:hypothetical protein